MSRIRKAYETRLGVLLRELNARQADRGVRWWSNHARQLSQREGISLTHAFERSVGLLRQRLDTFSQRHANSNNGGPAPSRIKTATKVNQDRQDACPTFFCDAGLGGLARWLRAAGYEAIWQ